VTELRPVAGDADLALWVDVHNRVASIPVTAGELQAYRDALDGGEIHLLALLDAEPARLRGDRQGHLAVTRPGHARGRRTTP